MRTQLTGRFLATLAASATSVSAVDAVAADYVEVDAAAINSRITLAFEGGVLKSDFDSDKLGSTDKLGDPDADIYGAISLTRQISADTDWRLSGAYHAGSDREISENFISPGGTIGFSTGDDFDFQTIDFDIGKRLQVANAEVRLFGGVRGLHVKEGFDFGLSATPANPLDKSGSLDKVGSSDFYGIGPRIGAEGYYALGQSWGLSGSVAGAAIWGRRNTELDFNLVSNDPNDPGQSASVDQDDDEVITNIELKAGVTWMPWENTAFTAGYRLDHWDGLLSGFSGLTGGDEDGGDQTFHGPFLKLEVRI